MINSSLQFRNERDKIYGLTGMAITLVACDGEKYLVHIDVDAPTASECMQLSPEFGIKGNPRMSARIVWNQAVSDLRLTASLAVGNIMCRRVLLDHRDVRADDLNAVQTALRSDAMAHCGLDNDEADAMLDSIYSYVRRLFAHSGIRQVAHSFASHLAERRLLSGTETVEILASLGLQ